MTNPLASRVSGDWATHGPIHHYLKLTLNSLGPALRLLLAAFLLWTIAGTFKRRKLTSYLSAIVGSFVTFSYLMPMFFRAGDKSHDVELGHVALFILSITAAFVGGALGSLLPRPMAGVTLGSGLALVIATFMPVKRDVMFTIGGPVAAVVGGILTTR